MAEQDWTEKIVLRPSLDRSSIFIKREFIALQAVYIITFDLFIIF